jgi:hypothetical protein
MHTSGDIKPNIIDFNNRLSTHMTNYTLLITLHIPDGSRKHEFTYHDNIHFLELHTISKTDGVEFSDKNDTVYFDNVLKTKYTFNIITPINISTNNRYNGSG